MKVCVPEPSSLTSAAFTDGKLHVVSGQHQRLVLRNRRQVQAALLDFHNELNHLDVNKCLRLLNERFSCAAFSAFPCVVLLENPRSALSQVLLENHEARCGSVDQPLLSVQRGEQETARRPIRGGRAAAAEASTPFL